MSDTSELRAAVVAYAIEECFMGTGASDELTKAVIAYLRADGSADMADGLERDRFGECP